MKTEYYRSDCFSPSLICLKTKCLCADEMGGPGSNRDRESEESKEVVARERRVDLGNMHAHLSSDPSSSRLHWKIKETTKVS